MATLSLGGASRTISDNAVTRIRAQLPKWGYAATAAGALDWLLDMARSTIIAAEQTAQVVTPPADPDFPPPTPLLAAKQSEDRPKKRAKAKRGR